MTFSGSKAFLLAGVFSSARTDLDVGLWWVIGLLELFPQDAVVDGQGHGDEHDDDEDDGEGERSVGGGAADLSAFGLLDGVSLNKNKFILWGWCS
jgi:hypothetical protein